MRKDEPVPYMRLTTERRPSAPRVKLGMTIEQVRAIWQVRSEAKTRQTMAGYDKQRLSAPPGYGREKFALHGQTQSQIARDKVRLAAKLLASAGLDADCAAIHKVTGQSKATIMDYWDPPQAE